MLVLCLGGATSLALSPAGGTKLAVLGAALLLMAATAGLMSAFNSRRDLLTLVGQIRERLRGGYVRRLDAPSNDILPLVLATNELVEQAEKSVSDALLKAKELEIQLK